MKKIYMILAVFALLTLSLNAQTKSTVTLVSNDFSDASWWTIISDNLGTTWEVTGGQGVYSYSTSYAADDWLVTPIIHLEAGITYTFSIDARERSTTYPEKLEVKFASANTADALSSGTEVIPETTLSSTTFTTLSESFTVSQTGDYYFGIHAISAINMYDLYVDNLKIEYNNTNPLIIASPSSVSMKATPGGTVTKTIAVTGDNLTEGITALISGTDAAVFSVSPASLGANGGTLTLTYSPTAVGTHSATLTLSSTGATDVTIPLNGLSVQEKTICDGTDESGYLPLYYPSYYTQKNQMIYPASELTDLVGKKLTSLTFYSAGMTFNGTYNVSLGMTTQSTYSSATAIEGLTQVVTGHTATNGATEFVITFDTPFEYTGDNLVIQIQVTDKGTSSYTQSVFYGTNQSTNTGYYYYNASYGDYGYTRTFLPKVTFTFENAGPSIEISPETQTINDAAAGTLTITSTNVEGNINVSLANTTDWSLNPTSLTSTGGTASVSYTGRALSASTTVTAEAANDNTVTDEATVNYEPDLFIYCDYGASPWDFSGNPAVAMTNNGDGTYTATLQEIPANSHILFGRASGLTYGWEGDANRLFIGADTDGADWSYGTYTSGTLDTDPNNDNPVKYHPIHFPEGGTYTITIDANVGTFTITKLVITPELTAPEDDSTVDVGTNYGRGVSKTINISGNNLTQDLTVSVSGAGFTVSRAVTVTAAEANAGKDITVTYNGTNANATGTLTIASSEVSATVHLTASYATSGAITVCDGEYYAGMLPVAGLYYDETEHNQMVYPASELADMEGMYITSMTFYPTTGTYTNPNNNQETDYSGINFYGGSVTFKLMNLSSGTSSFAEENPTLITGTMTPVSTVTPEKNTSATTWVITFDQPFEYTGGDLLIDVTTTAGTWSPSYFVVDEVNGNLGAMNCSYDGTNYYNGLDYLPKVTFTFNNGETPVTPVEGGLLRLHLLFCDQLKASIPEDNSHPDAYGYILKFEPEGGETKESGRVKVNIQKTDCEVMSYYTLDQIDRDTNRGLTMDVLTADVEYDLSSSNDMLNYYYLQGKVNGYPTLDGDYLSKLYRQEDFTYREMYEGSYEFDHVFNSGEHHYFNSAIDPVIGSYGDATKFVSYAPSVTTWGIQRRYFELDGKDNTYGAPVWKTAVGQVLMDTQVKPVVERQTNKNNSVNWGSGDEAASLYILDNVKAIGYLPPANLTKVEFEPYMFRIFVESKNGLLRPYKVVDAVEGSATEGEHLEAQDGELTEADTKGPICVWSGYINYVDGVPTDDAVNGVELSYDNINGPFTYLKKKVDRAGGSDAHPLSPWDKDSNNAIFGALDDLLQITGYDAQGKPIYKDIPEEDLRIFVRFYFSVKGEAADHTIWTRSEGSRSGNGAESDGSAAGGVVTAVKEIAYHGEVVGQTYYNIQGMESDQPFDGVNIVVTRYSDGTVSTSKVIR